MDKLQAMLPDENENTIATIVVVQPDGKVEEHTYDSNPAENALVKIMGSQVTIVGMWRSHDVILLSLRDPGDAPVNSQKLPYPFQDETIHGPIACVRMNLNTTNAENFTKEDWDKIVNMDAEEFQKLEEAAVKKREDEIEEETELEGMPEEEEEAEEEEEVVVDEEDEEDNAELDVQNQFVAALTDRVVNFYQEQHNRNPTPEELKEAMKEVLKAMQNGTAEYDSPDGAEDPPAEEVGSKRQAEEPEGQDVPSAKKAKTSEE